MASVDHDLTTPQWEALKAAWGGCAYCGAAGGTTPGTGLQRDTMLPISRGGRYTWDNVVPACASCNASKGNTELTSWMRRKKLDERAFWERRVAITADPAP